MKKIIVVGLLIISAPVLGAMQYAGKAITPAATPSYGKFTTPIYNVNYNKFNQNITPTPYRNISSFNQQQISGYKPTVTNQSYNQPNMEQARQLMEQAKPTTSDMMKK